MLCLGLLLAGRNGVLAGSKDRSGLAETTRLTTENFRTRGMDEEGRRQWDMVGAKAVVSGALANLEIITLTFFLEDGDTVMATSPDCVFNSTTQIGSSTAPIHIAHKQVTIDGKGYDIFTAERRIHIRGEVKMIIRQQGNTPEIKDLLRPQKTTAPAATGTTTPAAPVAP